MRDKQLVSNFFYKLAQALEEEVTSYNSFSDGSCEFFVKSNENNTKIIHNLVQEFFGHTSAKDSLSKVVVGEIPYYALVFNDPDVNLATFFVIEGNDELFRLTIKLVPLQVVEAFIDSNYDVEYEDDEDFGLIPAYQSKITWN